MEYLYEKLRKIEQSGFYAFHMPGHKRNPNLIDAELPYKIDITEINGFDDLHHPDGILKEAQERAADLYGAEETHYLINGSTAGLICGILGCTDAGDQILMARNCHKSVYNAVYINKLKPVYIYPELLSSGKGHDSDINGPVSVMQVQKLLEKNPNVKAVVITSPTYDGVVSDVSGIAEVVHKNRIPLILDEAHGAHFGFHSYFPQNGNQLGADIVIHSLHKTLPSLTQTALLHINGMIADREKIRMYLDMLQSSSPSYVLMASMDECIHLMEQGKEELFQRYTGMLQKLRSALCGMEHLHLWEYKEYDRSKILISTAGCSVRENRRVNYSGRQLSRDLREKYLLEFEMEAPGYAIAMTSPGDTESGIKRLIHALNEIDGKLAENLNYEGINSKIALENTELRRNTQVYCNWEIKKFSNKTKRIPYVESAGYISIEYAYVYPPGIPFVVPGERISQYTVKQLSSYLENGFEIRGTKEREKIEVLVNG